MAKQTPTERLLAQLPTLKVPSLVDCNFNGSKWQDFMVAIVPEIIAYGDTDKGIRHLTNRLCGGRRKRDTQLEPSIKSHLENAVLQEQCNRMTDYLAAAALTNFTPETVEAMHAVVNSINVLTDRTALTETYEIKREGISLNLPALQHIAPVELKTLQTSSMCKQDFAPLATAIISFINDIEAPRMTPGSDVDKSKQAQQQDGTVEVHAHSAEGPTSHPRVHGGVFTVEKSGVKRRKVSEATKGRESDSGAPIEINPASAGAVKNHKIVATTKKTGVEISPARDNDCGDKIIDSAR